jgi:hypothetical protein
VVARQQGAPQQTQQQQQQHKIRTPQPSQAAPSGGFCHPQQHWKQHNIRLSIATSLVHMAKEGSTCCAGRPRFGRQCMANCMARSQDLLRGHY